jgi:nucleoside-diphosphate-sugar epimerase
MRVLMTGHRGYLGSVMAERFMAAGHAVSGLDAGFYDECRLTTEPPYVYGIKKDLRELEAHDVEGFDAVVHLAALSNDPIGSLNSAWTSEINEHGSIRLAKLARQAGVERFLFSSSCIMYGAIGTEFVDESSPLDPKTEYARSKVAAERAISELATPGFSPVFLRNGTVYGMSPSMRFDTVVNNLVGEAVALGTVTLVGDGSPWRPVVNIEDVASAFLAALTAPREDLHNQAINAGSDSVNHTVREIAEMVVQAVPGSRLRCMALPDADHRTYRADFTKIGRLLPEFKVKWQLREGIEQLYGDLRKIGLSSSRLRDPRHTRLSWLKHLMSEGRLDENLRWQAKEAVLSC